MVVGWGGGGFSVKIDKIDGSLFKKGSLLDRGDIEDYRTAI